jgi:hypothetical protein
VFEQLDQQGNKRNEYFSVSKQNLIELYNEFKIQSFDNISTEKSESETVFDMGSEKITLSFNNQSFTVVADANFRFKNQTHKRRYQSVKFKFLNILKMHISY